MSKLEDYTSEQLWDAAAAKAKQVDALISDKKILREVHILLTLIRAAVTKSHTEALWGAMGGEE